jgi:hypothetical protein
MNNITGSRLSLQKQMEDKISTKIDWPASYIYRPEFRKKSKSMTKKKALALFFSFFFPFFCPFFFSPYFLRGPF